MRTVTFSDKKVADLVNKSFVSAWKNREPGFHNCEYATEASIYQSSRVWFPTKNICTFFLAPDGTVLHYISGYYDPSLFAIEVKKALKRLAAVELRYVPGHSGVELNERADALATDSVKRRASRAWTTETL